jgi:hypothetical protein
MGTVGLIPGDHDENDYYSEDDDDKNDDSVYQENVCDDDQDGANHHDGDYDIYDNNDNQNADTYEDIFSHRKTLSLCVVIKTENFSLLHGLDNSILVPASRTGLPVGTGNSKVLVRGWFVKFLEWIELRGYSTAR